MPSTPNLENLDRDKARLALVEANTKRREMLQALKKKEIVLEDLETAAKIDKAIGKLPVLRVVGSLPGVSAARAKSTLQRLEVDPKKTLKWLLSPSGLRQWEAVRAEFIPRDPPSEHFPYDN